MSRALFPNTARYRYMGTLGRGGMGVVFEALDTKLGRHVALKTLLHPDPMGVELLVEEFRVRQSVTHPSLLQMLELTVEPQHCFLTMELLEAVALERWIGLADPTLQATTQAADVAMLPTEVAPRTGVRLHLDQLQLLGRAACAVLSGLHALHRAGLVHRDVKPDNILVTNSGRAVLADFGLAAVFTLAPGEPKKYQHIAGTPGYLAPEARRGIATPATDLYALGATFYRIIVGAAPSYGDGVVGRRLREHCDDTRWTTLTERLLHGAPEQRPNAVEAFGILKELADAPELRLLQNIGLHRTQPFEPPLLSQRFVGRQRELQLLAHGINGATEHGRCTIAHVCGTSGIGKTTLVRRALQQLQVDDLLVLRGRCHPDEQLPYGGFDQIVTQLRAYLLTMPLSDGHASSSDERKALCTLFPRLRTLWPEAPELAAPHDDRLPRQVLRDAFAALERLLGVLATERRLIIWLEDAHWMDDDSRALLEALLANGGVTRTAMVLSYRPDGEVSRWLAGLTTPASGYQGQMANHVVVNLAPMPDADVQRMLRGIGVGTHSPERLHRFVRAAQGIPIFAEVLGRHALRAPTSEVVMSAASERPLVVALERQIAELEQGQLRVLSLVALSPRPLARGLLLRASRAAVLPADIVHLTDMGFLRSTVVAGERQITVFHDRIRQARLATLRDDQLPELHAQLAAAYEILNADAHEALSHHFGGARRYQKAAFYALKAARSAEQQLAFAAAAKLYERALRWRPEHPDQPNVMAKLAGARASQGLGEIAGRHFEMAAIQLASHHGGSLRCTTLLTRAAEQFFHCGHARDGYRVLREVLHTFGLRLPGSRASCTATSAWLRLTLIVQGTNLRPDVMVDRTARTRALLDALWMASTSLSHINHALADVLTLMHLNAALRAGAKRHTFRALTLEAGAEATLGGPLFKRRSARLLAASRRLLDASASDYDRGWYCVSRAACAFFDANWKSVVKNAQNAEEHLLRHRRGVSWERAINHMYWLFTLALMGDVSGLRQRHEVAFRDARERGDALAQNACRSGYSVLAWLYRGELTAARRELAQLLDGDRWVEPEVAALASWPEGGFGTHDYHNLVARTLVHLYAGETYEAYRSIRSAWPYLRGAMLLMVQFVGFDLRYLRARCALAARRKWLTNGPPPTWPTDWSAKYLLDDARKQQRTIARSGNQAAHAYALVLRAAISDDSPRARRRIAATAGAAFSAMDMRMHAAATRFSVGQPAPTCTQRIARTLVPMIFD